MTDPALTTRPELLPLPSLRLGALPEGEAGCDLLVLGAGPAGAACAQTAALAGWRVWMVDAHTFPREKTCGDGLVPDTHAALRELGVLDAVLARARRVPAAHCVAPSGRAVDVPGELAVLPRRELDTLVCGAALQAGAQLLAPVRFTALLRDAQGRVNGAVVSGDGLSREIRARWVVLATGASAGPLVAAGVCERRSPSAMALRGYVRHPALAQELKHLHFLWHPALQGGYGWIFPGPDGVLNIGAGVLDARSEFGDEGGARPSRRSPNLRELFKIYCEIDPVARRLMAEGESLGELKGAPLRCDLTGARWAEPGLLVAGDAVGATYQFTGEGIGKALETGRCAALAITDPAAADDHAVQARYTAELRARLPRFALYRKAASFNRHPWLLSLVVWRARRSPRLVARLADVLGERRLPGSLLSWRGLRAMLLG